MFCVKKPIYVSFIILVTLLVITLVFLNQKNSSLQTLEKSIPVSSTSPGHGLEEIVIHDIIPVGFIVVDEVVYWRFRVIGSVDLRNEIEINGKRGLWSGFIVVNVPNGVEAWVFNSPDYSTGRNYFVVINGVVEYDAPVYDLRGGSSSPTHPQSSLSGIYRVEIIIVGPYDEETGINPRVSLFMKTFNYSFKTSIDLLTLEWGSWSQEVEILVVNEGDVPVVFNGASLFVHGIDTVVGWINIDSFYIVVEKGCSRVVEAKLSIRSDFREYYAGRVDELDVVFIFEPENRVVNKTYTISFPQA